MKTDLLPGPPWPFPELHECPLAVGLVLGPITGSQNATIITIKRRAWGKIIDQIHRPNSLTKFIDKIIDKIIDQIEQGTGTKYN